MLEALATSDIYELLGVKNREDTFTSLLAYLITASPDLGSKLRNLAFVADPPEGSYTVHRQAHIAKGDIADILLSSKDAAGTRWEMFIETKVHSSEHGDQTVRYYRACTARVLAGGRVGGILLTLSGDGAKETRVPSLTHRRLADWIDEFSSDFEKYPVLKLAAEAYVQRARVPLPVAKADSALKTLLNPPYGLVPRLAGAETLGKECDHAFGNAWGTQVVWIQGRGHGHPGLLLRQAGWLGKPLKENGQWQAENFNIHLEIALVEAAKWRLKLHFETNPYFTKRELKKIANSSAFFVMRDAFRATLKPELEKSSGWKVKGKDLQIAVFDLSVNHDATVAEFIKALMPELAYMGPRVQAALAKARKAIKS